MCSLSANGTGGGELLLPGNGQDCSTAHRTWRQWSWAAEVHHTTSWVSECLPRCLCTGYCILAVQAALRQPEKLQAGWVRAVPFLKIRGGRAAPICFYNVGPLLSQRNYIVGGQPTKSNCHVRPWAIIGYYDVGGFFGLKIPCMWAVYGKNKLSEGGPHPRTQWSWSCWVKMKKVWKKNELTASERGWC